MLPQATSEDLLYISTLGPDVYVYSYPAGKLVGTLNYNFSFTVEECSDTDGNVFITNQARYSAQSGVYEFAHGGTTPIYFIPYSFAFACSLDPTTGNLAVVGSRAVSIYTNARGLPITYTDSNIYYLTDATYDGSGNLFIVGTYSGSRPFALLELPKGGKALEELRTEPILNAAQNGSILWDGRYLAIGATKNITRGSHHPIRSIVYRVQVSGSSATVIGSEPLGLERRSAFPQFWIGNHTIIQPAGQHAWQIDFWKYPKRGTYHRSLSVKREGILCLCGTTISVTLSHRRYARSKPDEKA